MAGRITADLCIIGAGSGGLSVAAGAAQMGARVVLIEGHKMGGDCLNYGCVPSKALIAASRSAQAHRSSGPLGIASHEPQVDYAAVMGHVQRTIAAISPHDSAERFKGLGVQVILAHGCFTGPEEVTAGDNVITARRFVIATGSAPVVPPIPGLDTVPYLTNETLWDIRHLPEILIIIGGGPIGLEIAQAHRQLGSQVIVLEAFAALGREDPEISAIALARLRAEGVDIREGDKVTAVAGGAGAIHVTLEGSEIVKGSHLMVAAGRRANVEGMGLDAAGIEFDRRGVTVGKNLRSVSNRRVYAIGDVAGGLQFTHVANYQAGLVIRSALFRLPIVNRTDHIPRVTFTDPEIAQAGLTEADARAQYGDAIEVHRFPFSESDRAMAAGNAEGMVKAVIGRRGRILGCSIVGAQAGELIHPWALALASGLKIGAMAGYVAPYPTLGEAGRRVAGAYFSPRLFGSRWVKLAVRLLARLG